MKAIVQRVMRATVTVEDEVISSIGRGLCVLIGISKDDTKRDIEYIARKILGIRLFEDERGKRWNLSVKDKGYEILCISQFTLYHVLKGNKLDFHNAMATEKSEAFYQEFIGLLRAQYQADLIKDGKFGAYMQVNIQNDGPVTIELESPQQEEASEPQFDVV
ncbi:D-aminoacyl-tRNA deacylase 1 [Cryptotermes secundus]|uniref:D-aminoacyl-tRNA deacylase 1 n=1 Tax=Cryptotermes secundus TaxID=105785 RepID=UPI000CD7D66C|nr:D-aminoacyl-tRNA deacylase 1 [Cryptotermes secundus]